MRNGEITCKHHDISFSYKGEGAYVTAYYKPELKALADPATWSPNYYN